LSGDRQLGFKHFEAYLVIPLAFLFGYFLRKMPLEELGFIAIKLPLIVGGILGVIKFFFVDKYFRINPMTSLREPIEGASKLIIGLELTVQLLATICMGLLLAALVLFGGKK
jgi:hypothetical protein